ncbi:Protein ICE2 [Lachancea thermotolerans]|uniref:KLTH0G10516p n=1 Tax=Lachancea thermotolerans (strain ATCC 56472 / CBS 6340 / NRRL Y-8284) TaxID=559295 RepID=C5DMP3_LACTC|nr:KLTH0G10516p [Lachancea thermotolerans CBS 6340]CAR25054.1 KLTH0G10516p [Lachancea thermotolerans CBS 6340]
MFPRSVIQSARVCLTSFYLLLILITIPISFQVGGLYCGLSFTVTLFNLYLITTTLKIAARARGLAKLASAAYYAQHFFIPSLLFLFLSGFSNDELKRQIDTNTRPDESLIDLLRSTTQSQTWVFYYYYYQYVVRPWQFMLLRSTPYFTLLEGFFTVLGIQAVGETNRWLSRGNGSNMWVISGLMASGGVITAALYYLYRIYVTPIWELSVQTASLLGFTFSIVSGLGIYGIVSGRGSTIESSLFFAYIVRCLYEISPQLATSAMDEIFTLVKETWHNQHRSLRSSDTLLTYYRDIILKNGEMVWDAILARTNVNVGASGTPVWASWNRVQPLWKFVKHFTSSVPSSIQEIFYLTLEMAREAIAPAVVINLCFRILIFYSATRIIPALQKKHKRRSRRFMRMLYWYSPCIVIAMYTHLILQYSGQISNDLCLWGCFPWSVPDTPKVVVDSWGFWNWCNIFCTMAIYASELLGSKS